MEDIVKKILELDRNAEAKLAEAQKAAHTITEESNLRSHEAKQALTSKTDAQLELLRNSEKAKTDAELKTLDDELSEGIAALDALFSERLDELADDIFMRITGE